jgi:CBS-domain-containing membrane protein
MKVKDVMMKSPCYCQPETNLGSATELMWGANCGFLPVQSTDGKIIGVITDRDICIALGTRNRLPGEVTVAQVLSEKLYSCAPEDDIHVALQTMAIAKVHRLPVTAENGTLVGVLAMDDILFRAEPRDLAKKPELSADEVLNTLRSIAQQSVPEVMASRTASA